jgi:hypothetical protein
MLIDAFGELVQVLDSQSRRRNRTDDIAEPIHPLMRFGNNLRVVRIIGSRRILSHRPVEVRNLKLELGRARVIAAHLRERVKLCHIEKPTGLDEARRNLRPSRDIRQPAQCPVRREHDIELLVHRVGRVVDV